MGGDGEKVIFLPTEGVPGEVVLAYLSYIYSILLYIFFLIKTL